MKRSAFLLLIAAMAFSFGACKKKDTKKAEGDKGMAPAADMKPEATLFDDLGLDSLDMVDMVIALEHAFKIKIRDEEEIRKIRTLGDIHRFVIGKVRETGDVFA